MARSRRRRPARRGLVRVVSTALFGVALLVGAVAAVVHVLGRSDGARSVAESCGVEVDGTRWLLSPVQSDNAALLTAVSVRRGLPARAATIAIATALQESKLVNLSYGDRDSVGLFQQRPSQGWGTAEQIMDPVYSTDRFYDGLVGIAGYQDLPITDAAQKVQRSAFPEAYAEHEALARAWAPAHSPARSMRPAALGRPTSSQRAWTGTSATCPSPWPRRPSRHLQRSSSTRDRSVAGRAGSRTTCAGAGRSPSGPSRSPRISTSRPCASQTRCGRVQARHGRRRAPSPSRAGPSWSRSLPPERPRCSALGRAACRRIDQRADTAT
jgi:hypothetical protein